MTPWLTLGITSVGIAVGTDNGASCDHRPLTDGHAEQDDGPGADPSPRPTTIRAVSATILERDQSPFRTTRDLQLSGAADAFTPQFVRQGKVFDAASGSYPTLYWPWIVKMTGKVASPLAAYYMYYSTDHAAAGGIAIAKGPTPVGRWTNHGEVSLIRPPVRRRKPRPCCTYSGWTR